MSEVTVRMSHCRELRYCSYGVREFFKKHGMDYSKFLKEGLPASEMLEACNHDGMVKDLVEVASGQRGR